MSSKEAYKKLAASVEESYKHPPFRIDPARLCMIVGNNLVEWPIKEDAHTPPIRNTVMTLAEHYEKKAKEIADAPRSERESLSASVDKEILELTLEKFSYDTEARNPQVGPVLLHLICNEMYVFLVELGGATGYQYSQMQHNIRLLNHFHSSQNSKKSSGYSTDTSPDSGT